MRIMLVNHFPLDGSGSGTYTKNIAVHLAMRGHQVCVVFPENEVPQEIPGVSMRICSLLPVRPTQGRAAV